MSLIGAQSSIQMGLIEVDEAHVYRTEVNLNEKAGLTAEQFQKKYPRAFKETVGCFPGEMKLE